MTTSASSYSQETSWRRYVELYPPELRDFGEVGEQWWTWNGMEVHLDRLPAPAAPVVVVLVHGAGGYGRMFMPFARAVFGERAEVVAPDLPGYGLTRVTAAVDYRSWADCVAALVEAERQRSGRPVVLFGASMGGMVAYDVAVRTRPAGVIATCLLDVRIAAVRRAVARWPWLGAAAPQLLDLVAPVADRARVPVRWMADVAAMSADSRLAAAVASDPVGGGSRVSVRFLRTFLRSAPAVEPEEFTSCPVLLAHPALDAWTPPALSTAFADRIAASTTTVLLEGAGHLPVEQPGLSQLTDAAREFLDRDRERDVTPTPPDLDRRQRR